MTIRRLLALQVVALLALGGCKATGTGAQSETLGASAGASGDDANGEPVLVCNVRDHQQPNLELEVFPTGFDPQLGMTIEVVIRGASAAADSELVFPGHGELSDASMEMLFDKGSLTGVADGVGAAAKGYDGNLEMSGVEARAVHCI